MAEAMNQDKATNRIPLAKRFFLQSYSSAVCACILLVAIFSIFTDSFLTTFNMFNLSRTIASYGFIAAAQLMVAVIGGMNLAVGAVGGLATVVVGILMQDLGVSSTVAIMAAVLTGLLCGLLNGFLITRLKLAPFVITLAMQFVYDGIGMGISHGYSYKVNAGFDGLGRGHAFTGTPFSTSLMFILFLFLVLVLIVLFRYTRFGRNILAVGGNESAARLSGINADAVIIACNVLSCMLAAVAAMLWTSRTGTASPTTGQDWMLYSFAVIAIGGISLNGGNFTAVGFLCGAMILTMVRNGLTMMNVDIYYEKAFIGAVILLAVSVESLRSKVALRMAK